MLLFLFHAVLVIGFTIRVLMRDDLSAVSRLAWFMVIAIVPVFGGIIYFLLGEVYLGPAIIKRQHEIAKTVHDYGAEATGSKDTVNEVIEPAYRPAFSYSASVNGFNTLAGNRAELMPDAATARERMIEDINAAQDHVHVLYYIWLDDETGTNTAKALIRAARRGVTCRAMADGLGSKGMVGSTLWREMEKAGVQLAVAFPINRPIHTILTSRLDLRNHRKITIIDGKITYCGSQNCADPEFAVKPKYAPWIDIMLRVEGPVVAQNQLLFAADWIFSNGGDVKDFPLITEPFADGFPAQIMGDGPSVRAGATPQLFSALMGTATNSLTISTPYFVPDATVLDAICAAAHRGVEVKLIFPKNNDSWIVAAVSHSYYRRMVKAGAQIHEYEGGLLHSKTLTIDGVVTFLGSSNMDLRSFDLNYENNILFHDEALTKQVDDRLAAYIAKSHQVHLEDIENWPAHRRIWNNVIATIGPVL